MLRRHALPFAALLLASACGPATPPPAEPIAVATAEPTAAPALPPAPTHVDAGAVPADTELYLELGGVRDILAAASSSFGGSLVGELRAGVARELGVDPALGARLVDAVASVHVGGKRFGGDVKTAVSMSFSDAQPLRDLLAAGKLTDAGAFGSYGRRLKSGDSNDLFVWFDGPRILVLGDEPFVQAMAAVVEGRTPPLSTAQRDAAAPLPAERRHAVAFIAPSLLDTLVEGKVSFPAPITAAYGLWDGGFRGAIRAAIAARDLGANIPLPPPRALDIARRLPADTAAYVALSTALPGGASGATRLLAQMVAGDDKAGSALRRAEAALASTGLRLSDILGSLGAEGVIAVTVRPGMKTKADFLSGFALIAVLDVADPKPADRLLKEGLDKAKKEALDKAKKAVPDKKAALDKDKKKPSAFKVRAERGGFSIETGEAGAPFVRAVRVGKDRVFIGVGQRDLVDAAGLAVEKGKGTLGDDAAHARARQALPTAAQLRLWIDLGRAAEMAAIAAPAGQGAALDVWRNAPQGPNRITSALSFSAVAEADRLRLEVDEVNGLGLLAAVGVFGVREYLAKSKTAEAKATVGAMFRAAAAAYEREQIGPGNTVVHALCQSADPVPQAVPRGKKYQPSASPGMDWHTGDPTRGWQCLKFEMTEPQYYQYTYTAGGPYKGPRRGGPDPGPNGFEVAAEGDLDGDGVTSLFTIVGVVDPQTGMVTKVGPIWVDKETE